MTAAIASVVTNLWRRRWFLVALWVSLSFVRVILGWLIGTRVSALLSVNELQLPRPEAVLVTLAFSYFWFRLCLLEKPETPGLGRTVARLIGRPRDFLPFFAYAAILLFAAGVIYVISSFIFYTLIASWLGLYALMVTSAIGEFLPFSRWILLVAIARFVPRIPLILLAPALARVALVLPAAAAGQSLTISQAWALSRGAWRGSAAMLAALCFTLLIVVPTNIYIAQLISEVPFLGRLSILTVQWVFMAKLAPVLIATAIVAELLADRYACIANTAEPAGPHMSRGN